MRTHAVVSTIETDRGLTRPDLMRLCSSAIEGCPMPIAATEGPTHIVRYANPAFCRLMGREKTVLLGHPCAKIIPKRRKDDCLALLDRVSRTGETEVTAEQEHLTDEGGRVYWSFMAWPVFDEEEQIAGVMLQVTDRTEATLIRHRYEKVEAEIRAINQQLLIASIREHELAAAAETDPRTELPWPESLRTRAIDHLKAGHEVSLLFIDLNDFGEFNKVYGHVVGDEVLQGVARALVTATDPDRDFLCRYGGDEFCVGTLRPAAEATALGERIAHQIAQIVLPALGETRIGCTIGRSGGHRAHEREHVHYLATINSLINAASRDCTAHKPQSLALPVQGYEQADTMIQQINQALMIASVQQHELADAAIAAQASLKENEERDRQLAVMEERNRIAREIHDTLAQVFTGILLQVGVVQRIARQRPEEALSLLENINELARQGMSETRRSVWALRPEAEEYKDLAGALSLVVERMASAASVQMEFHVYGTPHAVSPDVGLNLLRIVQEALTNAVRHAHAHFIWVELTFEFERVLLRIQDDGQGFSVEHKVDGGGFGLVGMGERAERLGGKLTIASQSGRGTEIGVLVPLPAAQRLQENE